MEYKETINFAFLAIIVMLVVHMFGSHMKQNNSVQNTPEEIVQQVPEVKMTKKDNTDACKIAHTEKALDDYVWGSLLGSHRICPDVKTVKTDADKAMDEHLRLRDVTYQSSCQQDTVDRVNMLYLANNSDIARGYNGTRIRDLFDQMTKGETIYNRSCVRAPRLPKYDTHVESGYYGTNGPHNYSLKRKDNEYSIEHSLNGGAIEPGMYGNDPEYNNYLSLNQYNS